MATEITRNQLTKDVRDRFASAAIPQDTGCIEWSGGKDRLGYGRIKVAGRMLLAHRVAVAIAEGSLTGELVVDHLCRNPSCVNVSHLELVPQRENIARGTSPLGKFIRDIERTGTCANGHLQTETSRRMIGGKIRCVECERERDRVRDARPDRVAKKAARMRRLREKRRAEVRSDD